MLPIVAVQIAPGPAVPALEEQLLRACSAGLERARCVSARGLGDERARGVAVVSWASAEHVSIEVGLARGEQPIWVSRELDFLAADPEAERWRAVGFTIALLADDPRFWPAPEPPEQPVAPIDVAPAELAPPPESRGGAWLAEVRGLGGSGVASGPMRWGAELRLSVPIASAFFATGSVDYAVARDAELDVRWLYASLGAGLYLPALLPNIDARLRVEVLGENVTIAVRRDGLTERQNAWVPGVSVGGDLLWPVADAWLLSARADAWVDGSTTIVSANQRIGALAGAGVVLGLGAGYRF